MGAPTVLTLRTRRAGQRAPWRAPSPSPSEHGGWGLTAEPVLLGLLVAFSWPGVAIAAATLLAFLIHTPLKLALVDRRRGRSLPRTRLAWRIAVAELVLCAGVVSLAVVSAGWGWTVAIVAAAPLFATELWFDARSRGRRLLPELCGAVGITSATAAIVVAGGGPIGLAAASCLVLAARAIASIPFVRGQVARLHRRSAPTAGMPWFHSAASWWRSSPRRSSVGWASVRLASSHSS